MKKQAKTRLVLAKEHLRVLDAKLADAAGGMPTTRGGQPSDCCSNHIVCIPTN